MSCGQIALDHLGIKVDNYFASEVDKYAIQITQKNYPDTIQLGNVRNVKATNLPKIDLLLAGSPCQGFSFAGKGLNFDDERSKLFFEFVRLLKECKPKYFLLENVKMKEEYLVIISKYVGVWPIEINSALVSAQNRVRLYWTNIKAEPFTLFGDLMITIKQPKDKGILLKDIIEENADSTHILSEKAIDRIKRNTYSNPCFQVGEADIKGHDKIKRVYSVEGKSPIITAQTGGNHEPKIATALGCALRTFPRNKMPGVKRYKQLEIRKDLKSNTLTGVQLDSLIYQLPHGYNEGGVKAQTGKTPSMTSSSWEHNNLLLRKGQWRKLTPLECERLQTVPDNYTASVSNTQRYKMLGNGWTVEVIAYILGHIKSNYAPRLCTGVF